MGEDLADVVAAGAKHGKERVADGAFQGAACQTAVGFHVSDLGFDGAAASEVGNQFWRQAAPGAADEDASRRHAVTAITAVDDGEAGALVGQDLH